MVKAAKKQPAKKQAPKKQPAKKKVAKKAPKTRAKKPEAKKDTAAAKQKKQTVTNPCILTELISFEEEQQKQDEVEVSDFEEESLESEEEEEEEETVSNKKAEKDEESDQDSMFIEIERDGFLIPDNEIVLDCNKTVHIMDTTLEIGFDLALKLISNLRRKDVTVEFSFDDKNLDWRYEFNNIVVCDYDSVYKYRTLFSHPPQGTTFLFRCTTDGDHTLLCNLPNLRNVYCILDKITDEKVETLLDKFILRNKKEVDDIPLKGSQSNASSSLDFTSPFFSERKGKRKIENIDLSCSSSPLSPDFTSPFSSGRKGKRKEEDMRNKAIACTQLLKGLYQKVDDIHYQVVLWKQNSRQLEEKLQEMLKD